jgi:hypothetical protein
MDSYADVATWNQLGTDGSNVSSTFYAYTAGNSSGDETILGKIASGGGEIVTAGVDWAASGGIQAGDELLSTNNGSGGSGPVSLNTNKISGLGAYIQADGSGPFEAEIQVFAGVNSILTQTVWSDAAGDPIFLGVSDTTAEITKVVYSLVSAPKGYSTGDFVLDSLMLQDPFISTIIGPAPGSAVPEPGMAPLVGLALSLLFLGFEFKKRIHRV